MATETLAQLFDIQVKIVSDAKQEKQKLIEIILESTPAEVRLNSLRKILLESQLQEETKSSDTFSSATEMITKVTELSYDQVRDFNDTIKKTFEPALIQRNIMNCIADVIRLKNLSAEEKITMISDFLI